MARPGSAPTTRRGALRTALIAVSVLALLVTVQLVLGIAAALAVSGMVAVLVGFVALLGAQRSGRARRGRRGAVAVLVVGGAGAFLGGTAFATPAPAAAPAPPAVAPVSSAPAVPTALQVLDGLRVHRAVSAARYDRAAAFGTGWTDADANGCATGDDVLRRDLSARTESGCRVLAGTFLDPYTNMPLEMNRLSGSSSVTVDHVVPLLDAWRTGAYRLSESERILLANDPANLLAADRVSVAQKDERDAAGWLPPTRQCEYVARQVAVKQAYGLWVTAAERSAMRTVLATCPDRTLPAVAARPDVVERKAACSTAGATAVDRSGRGLVCRARETGAALTWRTPA